MASLLTLPPPPDIVLRTKWYISIRWFVLCIITVPSLIALYITEKLSAAFIRDGTVAFLAIGLNGVFFMLTRYAKSTEAFARIASSLLVVDIGIITSFIFVNGGIESRAIILYALPILMAATLFGRYAIYYTTTICTLLYDTIIIGDYLGVFHTVGSYNPELRSQLPYVVNTVMFFSAILIIFGIIVEFITRVLREQEAYARESLNAMRLAQSIAKLGTWEWDIEKGRAEWSDELYHVLGVDPDLYPASLEAYLGFVHPEDQKAVRHEIGRAMKKPLNFSFDHRLVQPSGTGRFVHTEGQSIASKNGSIVRLVGTVRDVSEAVALDEAKTDFVSLASHQLRTPATGVKQYIGMLLDGFAGPLTSQQHQLLQTAYDSNERQLRIVDDLLYVAQIDSGKIKITTDRVDLVELIHDIIREQAGKFSDKAQTVIFNCRFRHLQCDVDRPRLRMALENIIDNAHKYTPAGKKITIKLTREPRYVCVAIIDQGVGIAQQDLHRLFRKFSRIDNPVSTLVGGTGLGLYWAARIISLHGGKIDLASQVGRGTTFRILLPDKSPKAHHGKHAPTHKAKYLTA